MAKNYKFLNYQRDWINNESQFAIAEKSRRIGITYAEAYRVTRDLAAKRIKNNKVWFSSADLSAAEEFIDYVGFWAKFLNTAAKYVGEVVIDKDEEITAHRVRFSNGGECNAISSNPTRFRSKGGDIILDEFAHHKDQEKMFTAAKPSMMWGNKVRIISTHNTDESYFNQLVLEVLKGDAGTMKRWYHFKRTLEDAIRDGLVDVILEHEASKEEIANFLEDTFSGMTQEAIDEEFFCKARSGATSHLLDYEMINAVERADILYEDLNMIQGDMFVGVDIARTKNFTVIWIAEKIGGLLITRKVIPLQKMRFRDQKEILYGVLSHPNFRKCCIDATGIGKNLAEDAAIDHGVLRVEEVDFNISNKTEMAEDVYVALDDKRTLIPKDKKIREDLYSIRSATTSNGKKTYIAEYSASTDKTKSGKKTSKEGSHADFFWGFALCNRAAKNYAGPLIITTGGKRIINSILTGY
jgi:phage FluMu gp28-like protein